MTPFLSGPVLRDTPLLRAMGFLVSQHGQLGAIPPPPFLGVSALKSMRSGGAIPPLPQRGISAILARYPVKTRQMGAIPPSAILSRKGIARFGRASCTGPLSAFFWSRNVGQTRKSEDPVLGDPIRQDKDSLARGDHPNFEKNAPRIWAKILASNQFRESLGELLRE